MGKAKDLTKEKVAEVKVLLNQDNSIRKVARICEISNCAVQNVKKRLAEGVPHVQRIGRCGRKRSTTHQDDRILLRNLRRNPVATSRQLKTEWEQHGVHVNACTVRRRLTSLGCKSVVCEKVPVLTSAMKSKRLDFAKRHINWTVDDWSKVNFS